jgi:methyl-galactoside transport system substrate-binding protein
MKKVFAILLACFMTVSVTACGSTPSSPAPAGSAAAQSQAASTAQAGKKPVIGVAIFDYSNNYVTYIRNSIKSIAGDTASIEMVDAQNDQTKQVEQIDLLLSKNVNALT